MSSKTLRITVDTHLRLNRKEVREVGLTVRYLREPFEYDNPDWHKKTRMGFYTGDTPKTLTLVEADPEELRIPRGAWPRLKALLEREGVAWEVVDRTVHGTGPLGWVYAEPGDWTLGPDQTSAARQAVLRRQGILLGPCASGKTEILLKAISDIGEETLVIVHTERILKDWVKSAAERFYRPEREIGMLYGKAKRLGPLTVGMVRTVLNHVRNGPKFAQRWGCVVLDEAHHAPASTFAELVNSFPARWRLAATATPRRKDGKEILFYDTFGSESVPKRGGGTKPGPRVLFEITDGDLDRYGRIVPVDVVVVPTEFEFDLNWEARLEEEGFERKSKESALAAVKRWARLTRWTGGLNDYTEMLDEMSRDRHRQARVLEFLLPEIQAGRSCLLLADRREFCLELQAWLKRRKIEAGRLMGGRDSKVQDQTAAGLTEGTLKVAVGTTVGDEGMNIPRLARGFGCTPTAGNPGRLTQQLGRFKRKHPTKDDAVYFYFWDPRVRGLLGHARAVANAVKPPHRVWYSETPGERVPLTPEKLRELEGRRWE